MYKGKKRGSDLKEVWWVVRIIREAKVVGVRVWIMTHNLMWLWTHDKYIKGVTKV